VVPVVRDRNSGTYEALRQLALGGADPVRGALCRTSQEVVDRVASDLGGIGCVGLAWLKGGRVKALRIAQNPEGEFVAATAPHVYKNRYPIRRPFMACVTGGTVEASPRAGFIAFLTSERGQIIVESEGLVPDTVPERIIQLK
jgi:ABC-type phosphate transport system substrate-binding protein